jgi:putative inorganic carbon (HCO3(-)) transporter
MVARLTQSDWRSWLPERLVELGLCLSLILFARWQQPPASLLLLVCAAALAWVRIEIAIALLPLTLPYYLDLVPLSYSASSSFSVGELSILICFGVALLRSVFIAADRRATLEWLRGLWRQAGFFLLPAALLLVGASLALLVSPDQHYSLRYYRWDIIEPLLYFLLVLRYLRTRKDLARAVVALILSGLIVSGIAITQGFLYLSDHASLISGTTSFRPGGPYSSPNNVGLLLDRVIPLVLAVGLTHILHRSSIPGASQRPAWRDPLRWACVLVLIPLVWALYWSRSRGAEVAILIAVLFFFVIEIRQWIAIAVVFAAGAVGAFLFRSRLLNLLDTGHNGLATLSERFTYWKAALLIIRDHFFLGTGPDSFNHFYNPHSPNSYALKALDGQPFPSTYDPGISHPHNIILDFWISSGLLGLAALFWLLGAFAIALIRIYHLCKAARSGDLLQRLLLGIAGCMVATVVHGMVDNSYFLPDLSVLFWFFIAALLILGSIVQREQTVVPEEAPPETTLAPITKASS